MTGFQPHAGIGIDAVGRTAPTLDIAGVCQALGLKVRTCDPFQMEATIEVLVDLLADPDGIKVVVLRHLCGLLAARRGPVDFDVRVDAHRCRGEACGCNRLCTRVFRCPGLRWDEGTNRAAVDEAVCSRCGYCLQVCPAGAIQKVPREARLPETAHG